MRRQARELSLQILFQIEFTPQMSLSELTTLFEKNFEPSILSYALEIVNGVKAHKEKIDSQISLASTHWKIDRMASVDRNLLRSACYEMFYAKENLEPKIVINEAVEIAKIFGTAESSAFINGLLDQIVKNTKLNK